jgi:hypothetical protein
MLPASVQATRRILRRSGVQDSSSTQKQIDPQKVRYGERTDLGSVAYGRILREKPLGSAKTKLVPHLEVF